MLFYSFISFLFFLIFFYCFSIWYYCCICLRTSRFFASDHRLKAPRPLFSEAGNTNVLIDNAPLFSSSFSSSFIFYSILNTFSNKKKHNASLTFKSFPSGLRLSSSRSSFFSLSFANNFFYSFLKHLKSFSVLPFPPCSSYFPCELFCLLQPLPKKCLLFLNLQLNHLKSCVISLFPSMIFKEKKKNDEKINIEINDNNQINKLTYKVEEEPTNMIEFFNINNYFWNFFVRFNKAKFFAIFSFFFVSSILEVFSPHVFNQIFTEKLQNKNSKHFFKENAIFNFALVLGLMNVLDYLRGILSLQIMEKGSARILSVAYQTFMVFRNLRDFDKFDVVSEWSKIQNFCFQILQKYFFSSFSSLRYLILILGQVFYLFLIDKTLAFFSLFEVFITFLVSAYFAKKQKQHTSFSKRFSSSYSVAAQSFFLIKLIKAHNSQGFELQRYINSIEEEEKCSKKKKSFLLDSRMVLEALKIFFNFFFFLICFMIFTFQGKINFLLLSKLTTYVFYYQYISQYSAKLGFSFCELCEMLSDIRKIREDMLFQNIIFNNIEFKRILFKKNFKDSFNSSTTCFHETENVEEQRELEKVYGLKKFETRNLLHEELKTCKKLEEKTAKENEELLCNVKEYLVYENFTFAYSSNPEKKVLNRFSLSVRIGETVGVWCDEGRGKSTLAKATVKLIRNALHDTDGVDAGGDNKTLSSNGALENAAAPPQEKMESAENFSPIVLADKSNSSGKIHIGGKDINSMKDENLYKEVFLLQDDDDVLNAFFKVIPMTLRDFLCYDSFHYEARKDNVLICFKDDNSNNSENTDNKSNISKISNLSSSMNDLRENGNRNNNNNNSNSAKGEKKKSGAEEIKLPQKKLELETWLNCGSNSEVSPTESKKNAKGKNEEELKESKNIMQNSRTNNETCSFRQQHEGANASAFYILHYILSKYCCCSCFCGLEGQKKKQNRVEKISNRTISFLNLHNKKQIPEAFSTLHENSTTCLACNSINRTPLNFFFNELRAPFGKPEKDNSYESNRTSTMLSSNSTNHTCIYNLQNNTYDFLLQICNTTHFAHNFTFSCFSKTHGEYLQDLHIPKKIKLDDFLFWNKFVAELFSKFDWCKKIPSDFFRFPDVFKKKLLILKVILNRPKIIFLDEFSNNLDSKNEKLIDEVFFKRLDNETIVIKLSNDLEKLRFVDRIVRLKDGKISVEGTYESLKKIKTPI